MWYPIHPQKIFLFDYNDPKIGKSFLFFYPSTQKNKWLPLYPLYKMPLLALFLSSLSGMYGVNGPLSMP